MTDINERLLRDPAQEATPEALGHEYASSDATHEQELMDLAELLFFAYRDFTSEPDKILAEYGFGRAHHRVLHFVNRHPGMRVADLLDILKITKQSLGRVLKQLVDDGFIAQKAGKTDRRERLLYPTQRGRELAERLAAPQLRLIADALDASGDARAGISTFLHQMISEQDRTLITELLNGTAPKNHESGSSA